MKIIVPMAGRGSRLRPHTLTVPKPLIPVAGKSIVQRLVEDITRVCGQKVEEIAYVIGDFGKEVEESLVKVAEDLGAKGSIYYQDKPLGTAHAILCAKESMDGPIVVAFADTLFKADFTLDADKDGIIWVQSVEDPSAFGVVKTNDAGVITDFIEKPETFVSDKAIIGIYYFKDGAYLRSELQYLLDNDIKDKGEYQLTNALENMKQKGAEFRPGEVVEWLDCGNKDATVHTNQRVLEFDPSHHQVAASVKLNGNSKVIAPCFIGENVELNNSTVGPHVSIGKNTVVSNSSIQNTIIQNDTEIKNAQLKDSMIGSKVKYNGEFTTVSIGDFSCLE